ncbi:MAG: UDP-2,4-diacetamido-2,4,6-trideoxy-beta-L-altropyranose hydrolase [Pseudomonadales bacterium]|nr:UDP-2,4-diacetamido-2,4,6-trideoxy-beta-L-altropyranose hydrolase [Pseudomonadales bacterium]MBH2078094.1 UDP-2,4-diacetamido-2,4,6-trideoxy-beta-L-altropyranose hydrolase [Pseudomonadales bacterium]
MQPLKVAFRVDASLQMGTGHVMRCLTLANALKVRGAECQFICREHPGNLIAYIRSEGFQIHVLPLMESTAAELIDFKVSKIEPQLAHATWLGATQRNDADECSAILSELKFDWLIVDHYALDVRWEVALKRHYRKLMVIDDLADRPHQCDILLDQTFGRESKAYAPWIPDACILLCGSRYSLLRPEFAALRAYSIERRKEPHLEHLLITMGGVDKDNATGQVLQALKSTELPANCRITVVMGTTAPWLAEVRKQAKQMPWATTVQVGVSNMAQLMADSDLAIGAAGATTWERCCLGLPTVLVVLADNQKMAAETLDKAQAVVILSLKKHLITELALIIENLRYNTRRLKRITEHAKIITDGTGSQLVASMLYMSNI